MLDSGDVVRVDSAELETVIPQPGGQVRALEEGCQASSAIAGGS